MQKCNYLSVALDMDGKQGLENVDIGSIIYIEYDAIINRVIFHTMNKKYFMMGTLKFYEELLNNSGYNFKLVDRNNIVNIHNIVCLDKSTKKAYFEWPTGPASKSCTFSGRHFNQIMQDISGTGSVVIV